MTTIKLLAIALVAMIGLSCCSKECNHDTTCNHNFIEVDYSQDIVGTWTCLKAGFAETLVFNANGTFSSFGVANGDYWEDTAATWVLKNNKLTLSSGDYKSDVTLEIIPGASLALVDAKGNRNIFNYCANDLSDEIVGLWVCTDSKIDAQNDMMIETFYDNGKTVLTGFLPMENKSEYVLEDETDYMVVGDLMFLAVPADKVGGDKPMYIAERLIYSPMATALGDIMTFTNYADKELLSESWLRIKQDLNLANAAYDYNNIYVTNVKGNDVELEFAGKILNFKDLNGDIMDKLMKNILFGVSFPSSDKISYNCYYNGKPVSIEAPIEVDGNKVTIKMSEIDNKSYYRDIEVYAFQDVDRCQMHMYMPTKSFEAFMGNIGVVLQAKENNLNLNDKTAVEKVFKYIEDNVETINVSFIFKAATRAL